MKEAEQIVADAAASSWLKSALGETMNAGQASREMSTKPCKSLQWKRCVKSFLAIGEKQERERPKERRARANRRRCEGVTATEAVREVCPSVLTAFVAWEPI